VTFTLATTLARTVRELAEPDHREEDQTGEQHDQDHMLAVGNGIENQAYGSSLVEVLAPTGGTTLASKHS
jgi:hypothetical protein